MSGLAKYFIVEASAMPEIYRKVAQAKNLLETGEETTVNAAGDYVVSYIVSRFVDGKDWLEKALAKKR